jgi:uncharacterized protein (TIGR00730 family)
VGTAIKSVCVFCGSSHGRQPQYADAARELGIALASAGIRLIYGGASVGLMGILADAVLANGGTAIGVIPRSLEQREIAHLGLTELHLVKTMHQRKALMASLSDAFIALPGGLGTLEEFFEIWTWSVLGAHNKPCGILNVAGYYQQLLGFVDWMVLEEFVRPVDQSRIVVEGDPEHLLTRLAQYESPATPKWVTPERI